MGRASFNDQANRRFTFGNADRQKWLKAKAIKLRRDPICQVRVKCKGAAASEVSHFLPLSSGGSPFDPNNLQSTCGACQGWKLRTADLKMHP